MSKLTQGHIDTLVHWMVKNPGMRLNVSGTWKNNGFEVLNGYQTEARQRVYKVLTEWGYDVDKEHGILLGRKTLNKDDIRITAEEQTEKAMQELAEVIEPKHEGKKTSKVIFDESAMDVASKIEPAEDTLLKKAKEVAQKPPTYEGKHPEAVQKPLIHYNIDLTADNLQSIAKSLQGAIHTAMLMHKKAKVNVTVNFE